MTDSPTTDLEIGFNYLCLYICLPTQEKRSIRKSHGCTDLTGEEGKEEPGDLDGVDNVLAVAAFAILFVISFLYSTFVTIVKVLK
ncbi:igW transmembrane form Tm2T7/Tm7T7/Tm3T3-like isoform X2 [Pristis pectinata]|uniref:igW transmembrane form Tm2T7/Tm7T7/Tm3T3-like isoform X2 n=1 Tax=Pristis pectinata TaxID=685728 RepID=UPI00223C9FAD|nr:igW transmembrane form Tm2T7/Tm7T7/Tm3T3-like isoform X2 [Pristis pectinata]